MAKTAHAKYAAHSGKTLLLRLAFTFIATSVALAYVTFMHQFALQSQTNRSKLDSAQVLYMASVRVLCYVPRAHMLSRDVERLQRHTHV